MDNGENKEVPNSCTGPLKPFETSQLTRQEAYDVVEMSGKSVQPDGLSNILNHKQLSCIHVLTNEQVKLISYI